MKRERTPQSEGRLVCLGEALVDLICPDSVAEEAAAERFEVHFGGALSNVAIAARRAGADVALAGGTGDDRWGRFLRGRFEREGIDTTLQTVVEGVPTPFAFATLDGEREPAFEIHGAGIDAAIATLAGRADEIVAGAAAIVFGSNTMVDPSSREVTGEVRAAAVGAGVPLLFDPNLRPGRWRDRDLARRLCLDFAADTTVLKCNLAEARWFTGSPRASAGEAAQGLLALGPRLVVVTAGAEGVASRGTCELELDAPAVTMVSPLGAGDVFMGTLAAGLLDGGWDLGGAPAALERAVAAGAEACTRLGAFD